MNKLKYTFLCLGFAVIQFSCKEKEIIQGQPVLELKTEQTQAFFGDSLPFTVNVRDAEVPLSTLKAQLFFDNEKVSETIIRTKDNGKDYNGKIYIPFLKNVPNGKATLKYILQNINFTIAEQDIELPCIRPQFDYLTLITKDGKEYQMNRTGDNFYETVSEFPQRVDAYIKAPAYGANGNDIYFGYSTDATITQDSKNAIPFTALQAGKYSISFNTMTYEGSPFVSMKLNGKEFESIDENTLQLTVDLAQGENVKLEGIPNYDSWYIDPDYFTIDKQGNIKFNAMDGTYKIRAITDKMYFSVMRMNGDNPATLDKNGNGALWILGWGVGHPSLDYQFGWSWDNETNGYCMAEISPQVYQFSGYTGPETESRNGQRIRYDYLDFKFYKERTWDTEFKQSEMILEGNLLNLAEPNDLGFSNINLSKDTQLEINTHYVLTVDLTKGNDKPIIKLEKK